MNDLHTAIEYLKGVGPNKANVLKEELKIFRFADLLQLFPYRYVDRSRFYQIQELGQAEAEVQLLGQITRLEEVSARGGKKMLKGSFADDTGQVELIWFKGLRYLKDTLKLKQPYVLYGKPQPYKGNLNFAHPELELHADFKKSPVQGLQPLYPSSEKLQQKGLNNRGIARLTRELIPQVKGKIPEFFPADFLERYQLMLREQAYREVHFPRDLQHMKAARWRLKFEELFFLQLELVRQKQAHHRRFKGYPFKEVGPHFNHFYQEKLPFALTQAQKRVLREIRRDVQQGAHMNRLLQGDVGSGKTIVALMAMLLALDNGFQACLMAPTEILAQQHYQSLAELLEGTGTSVALLTGSTKAPRRKEIHAALRDGSLPILIGTHALLEEKVQYHNLGLAVVDEQHRFGVAQRARLWKKNELPPHILVMTATPIPRTLAMTLYGNLDVSVIDELPPGRKPIRTEHRYDTHRLRVFNFLKEQITAGRQVYIVYPLIEESAKMDYKDLMDGYESIMRAFPRPDYDVSIVHGRMRPEDKEIEMQRFAQGKSQIMVATTVIEVGVNVPNATVMVIESAERFGLSQLHQLRGRVGRGGERSYCILMSSHKLSNEARTRLRTMTETQDGFKIAEVDMKLRGIGDLMGTRQSGLTHFQIADLTQDGPIVEAARQAVAEILENDPQLQSPAYQGVLRAFERRKAGQTDWGRIS
ncbi:MAG: ATP-dependent DNA helicase RecG [Schleiferiaceae bacterium]|nr:ATP-dependent DNA helicase RecG [Schleiferiaceae bacterium]MDR9441871.1 ATP-dependent DNA helicase RecG [Schleiferiaceae bacterium]